jgi:hypothetical protein
MSDLVTEAPITDEELAEAIRVRDRQVRNGITVLQLILDHIPPETRRVQWSGQQDYYRNIPQAMRGRFLERLDALRAERSNPPRPVPTTPVRTWPPTPVR